MTGVPLCSIGALPLPVTRSINVNGALVLYYEWYNLYIIVWLGKAVLER